MNYFFKLNKYNKNVYSQTGEDGIIEYLIKTSKETIYSNSVEFGGHDGVTNSNTYNLYINHNFNSLIIEADKSRFDLSADNYFDKSRFNAINKFINIKGKDSIDDILESNNLFNKQEIGVMSIDIDSTDYHVFKNLNCKPQIIIIEFNNAIPGYIEYNDPEEEVYLRCSAKAIQNLGFIKGYKTVCCTVLNCILIKDNCFNPRYHPDLPVEFLLDYDGMHKTNDLLFTIIHSQMYTTYPISTKPLNNLDKFYFKFSRFLMSALKIRKEKFIKPSELIKKKLEESKLFIN